MPLYLPYGARKCHHISLPYSILHKFQLYLFVINLFDTYNILCLFCTTQSVVHNIHCLYFPENLNKYMKLVKENDFPEITQLPCLRDNQISGSPSFQSSILTTTQNWLSFPSVFCQIPSKACLSKFPQFVALPECMLVNCIQQQYFRLKNSYQIRYSSTEYTSIEYTLYFHRVA